MPEAAYNSKVESHPMIRHHWRTDETSGNLIDTPGTLDLTHNFTPGQPGPFPGAAAVTGDGTKLAFAAPPVVPAAPRTYAIWCRTTSTASGMGLMGHQVSTSQRFTLTMLTGGIVRFTHDLGNDPRSRNTLSPINDGAWHLVVGTVDATGQTLNLYLDGAPDQQAQGSLPLAAGGTYLYVGARGATAGWMWDGEWSHAAIWDAELNAAEVAELYQAAMAGPVPWHLLLQGVA